MVGMRVALVQLDAGLDVEANVAKAVALAEEAAATGTRLVACPKGPIRGSRQAT